MILLALFLIVLGVALARWLKVFVLVPATVLAWVAAVNFARLNSLSLLETLVAAFICGACLQLGYLAGAVLVDQRARQMKKLPALVARR